MVLIVLTLMVLMLLLRVHLILLLTSFMCQYYIRIGIEYGRSVIELPPFALRRLHPLLMFGILYLTQVHRQRLLRSSHSSPLTFLTVHIEHCKCPTSVTYSKVSSNVTLIGD